MKTLPKAEKTVQEELDLIFQECQDEICSALQDYERETHESMNELKEGIRINTRLAS
jgi:hypothetical protein